MFTVTYVFSFSEKGVKVAFYSKGEAQQKFPFMNFDDVAAVTCGKLTNLLRIIK